MVRVLDDGGCQPKREAGHENGLRDTALFTFLSKGGHVAQTEWEWPIISNFQQQHNERVALLRPILYEMTAPVDDPVATACQGKALSVNISRGGILLLMDQAPAIEQVLKVLVPTPMAVAETPTLAEVRWTRKLPFGRNNGEGTYFVGLKFIF